MKFPFLPQTKLGKYAAGLIIFWPVLTILGTIASNVLYLGVEAGNGIIDDLRVRPILAVTMLLGISLGVMSFPMSLVAIFRKGERSVLSFLAAFFGLFLTILLVGEFIIKH